MGDKAENVIWLKDNKPLDDRLADRISAQELAGNYYRLDIKHCSETDSGLYSAKAANGADSSTCSAQLIVHESMQAIALILPQYTALPFR